MPGKLFFFAYIWITTFVCESSHSFAPRLFKGPTGNTSQLPLGIDKFHDIELKRYIGQGRFSSVFECVNTTDDSLLVVKILKHNDIDKCLNEISSLNLLEDVDSIIKLYGWTINNESNTLNMYFEHIGDCQTLSNTDGANPRLTEREVCEHFYALMTAINACHKRGIIHRDIKPQNVLVNRAMRQTRLIDFGLSKPFEEGKRSSTAGSRSYKSPELLMGSGNYDFSVDIWAAGCILAGLIFKQEPFFSCCGDLESDLLSIVSVTGSEDFGRWFSRGDQNMPESNIQLVKEMVRLNLPRTRLEEFVSGEQSDTSTLSRTGTSTTTRADVLDLISRMLTVDPSKRISAAECLEHPYFASAKAGKY